MYISNIEGLPVKTKIDIKCDGCGKIIIRSIANVKWQRKQNKTEADFCKSCGCKNAAKKRPQNTKEFWQDPDRKLKHGNSVKLSAAYQQGIKNRSPTDGSNNNMWGKKHTVETKNKMSEARKGKTGEKATAWKGGKLSLNRRIKSALQRKYNWFHNVMDRDNCTCQHCGAMKKLDVHHIKPLANIIKLLLNESDLLTESEKMDWLIIQPEIVDSGMLNGITLCRDCHRKIHKNWGSHEPKV